MLPRNAPSLLNVAYATSLFRDGRAASLEDQVWGPLLSGQEMGNGTPEGLLARLRQITQYEEMFAAAFGAEGLAASTLARSLAAFQRSLIAGNSRFDRWYYGKDGSALSEKERHGFRVFIQANCVVCHEVGPKHALFSDNLFHNIGTTHDKDSERRLGATDLGRMKISGDEFDRGAFRTPSLRNVALTAPYMHDGSLATLKDVVDYYNPCLSGCHTRPPDIVARDFAA